MPDGVTVNPEVVPQEIEVTVSADEIDVEVAELVDMDVSVELVDHIIDVEVSAPDINIVCEFVGSHSSSGVEDVTFDGESIVEDRVAVIPSSLSDYNDDATHRLVTDTEKATWDSKADVSDIPTALSQLTDDATHRLVTDTEKATWNGKANIDDASTSSTTASWSASKLNSVLGNIESALDIIRGV